MLGRAMCVCLVSLFEQFVIYSYWLLVFQKLHKGFLIFYLYL